MKKCKILAVIFDMDGVLVDSEGANINAARKTFRDLGLPLTKDEEEQIPGRSSRVFVPEFMRQRGITDIAKHERIIAINRQNYDSIWENEVKLMPDAANVISALSAHGIKLAIASTNRRSRVERFLEKFEFREYFAIIVTGNEVKNLKPDPDLYLLARKELAIPSKHILVIEDTQIGVEAAKNAGLACGAIPNRYSETHDFSMADYIFQSLKDVMVFIL